MKDRVLIVGSHPTLLKSRRDVLEANGIPAETKLVEAWPGDLLISPEATVVVACSSLSAAVRKALVNSAQANPGLSCLVVEPSLSVQTSTASAGPVRVVHALEGPGKFVSRVQEMMSQNRA